MSEDFFNQVYQLVRKVPYGRVTTYGHIARYLGANKSARVVGWALNASHTVLPSIPAHRVVNRIGVLSGKHHFGATNLMQELLEKEGVEVKDFKVVAFQDLLWDPYEYL